MALASDWSAGYLIDSSILITQAMLPVLHDHQIVRLSHGQYAKLHELARL